MKKHKDNVTTSDEMWKGCCFISVWNETETKYNNDFQYSYWKHVYIFLADIIFVHVDTTYDDTQKEIEVGQIPSTLVTQSVDNNIRLLVLWYIRQVIIQHYVFDLPMFGGIWRLGDERKKR